MRSKALAAPYMAWMAIFTIVPLAVVAYYAFTNNAGEFTLDNLANAATYWPTFLRSVWYALAACVICLIIGYPVAYVIAQTGARTQRVLYLLVTLPMCMSFLLRTLAWVALLRDTGIINSFLGSVFGIGPLRDQLGFKLQNKMRRLYKKDKHAIIKKILWAINPQESGDDD